VMQTIKNIRAMQRWADVTRSKRRTIGLVPTMGCLHNGHLSLVRLAKEKCDAVVVSIFVNPTQFAPGEDFRRYPRDLSRDQRLLRQQGLCDIVFAPQADEMYPLDYSTSVTETRLGQGLCGRFRPTHFQGVTIIVEKLINIVKPHIMVFGQKDYQQAAIIRRMAADLNNDVVIISAPTVREADGLAMSSRNQYLSPEERREALVLPQALALGRQLITKNKMRESGKIIVVMRRLINTRPGVKLQYLEIVDARTLEKIKKINDAAVIVLAAYVGRTRLIDNITVRTN
jgi:pantoate--beta-alanine ligase